MHIEAETLCDLAQVRQLEMRLAGVQEVVHLPEPSLRPRCFRGLGRDQRMRVDLFQREMAENQPYPTTEVPEEQPDRRRGLLAVRTFEITVLDDRHGRVVCASHVVLSGHGVEGGGISSHIPDRLPPAAPR